MFSTQIAGDRVPIRLWAPVEEVEGAALRQLRNAAALPWAFHHVAVMPDVHYGIGATVGSVLALKDAVSPAAVGVDIGCGMGAVKTGLSAADLPEDLKGIRRAFEGAVPVAHHAHAAPAFEGAGPLEAEAGALLAALPDLTKEVRNLGRKAALQLGTLGGGNHFIELCLDTEDGVWILLHSGSRNLGKTLAEVHIAKAKRLAHNRDLPDPDLSVFLSGTPQMQAYRHDLFWAQRYAMLNRRLMMVLLLKALGGFFPAEALAPRREVWCHHNYVAEERHFGEEVLVTRKGAIRAGRGEAGIIPGSMGTRSFLVRGLGNPLSFESASHGAGRRMSRTEARRRFGVEDLEAQTRGVECRKDLAVLDEIPGAYKDIGAVMERQRDLVEVEAELRQVLCVKG